MGRNYSIGPIVGAMMKPKFVAINTFLGNGFEVDKSEPVDMFIDLNMLVNALSTSSKFMQSLPFNDGSVETDIIANILSIVKHWKMFYNAFGDVRIFFIVNDFETKMLPERDIIKSYLVPYTHKFDQERFAQFNYYWTESMKKLEIVLKYIPKTYLIRCNSVDSYIIPSIIDDYTNGKIHRVILTASNMMTQYMLETNTTVILSRYKHLLSDPLMICKHISKIDDDIMKTFISNKVFYSLLNGIIGDFDRGLIGITQMGISITANDLLRSVERNEIPSNPKSIESVLRIIQPGYHDYLKKAYTLIDIDSHKNLIPQSKITKIKSDSLIDLYDIDGLSKLSIDGMNLVELL